YPGHACPILYAAWAEAGLFDVSELLKLRKLDSDLEGHPTPRLNFIDVATGSLGQGLGFTVCTAWLGMSAEGSIWEALSFASFYKLDNLVAVFDVNRLGQSDPAMLQHEMDVYEARLKAFGWNTYVVDGHDVEVLCKTLHDATTVKDKPTCILAKTFKGKGLPGIEDQMNWHGKPMGTKADELIKILKDNMSKEGPINLRPQTITATVPKSDISNIRFAEPLKYEMGQQVATRMAYGVALAKLGSSNDRVIALDGDTKNSTFSDKFRVAHPERFIECYIAEQNLVGVAIGCATRDRTVAFCSTFAAFFTRAFDQIRMGAISQTNVNFAGSHAGISIGEDGPSQMALEDLAMFRSIPGSTVFYPSDAVSCERAVELAANTPGVCFIRTSRPNVPIIYGNDEVFEAGKAKVVRRSDSDKVTVIGCCVTLVEAIRAADKLALDGINIRIIDPFTLKPLDRDTILSNAKETGGRIITVEDHYEWGGLGDAVAGALSEERNICIKKLAVREVPRSGKPAELMEKYGISANCIVKAVHSMLK
ncbi:LOW QUALITY PROTEIN: TKTL2-like protein, partial [Mya arenaria]